MIKPLLGLLGVLAFVGYLTSGCRTTNVLRDTPATTAISESVEAPGYSRTEVVETSRDQYRQCIETRSAQANTVWTDNQAYCFSQTTVGQAVAGMYGYGSQQFIGYGQFFAGNYGGGFPMATGAPNIVMVNGRPMVIPAGANMNDGVASPYAVAATVEFERLRRLAPVAQGAVLQGAPVNTPVGTAATATTPAISVTQQDWDALLGQVMDLVAAQPAHRHRH